MGMKNMSKEIVTPFLERIYRGAISVKEVCKITGLSQPMVFRYLDDYRFKDKKSKLLRALRRTSIAKNINLFRVNPNLYIDHRAEFELLHFEGRINLKVDETDDGQVIYVNVA